MELSEAGLIALSGSVITVISLFLKCFLRSRCSSIKICFGIFDCVRQPLTLEEINNVQVETPTQGGNTLTPNQSNNNLQNISSSRN